MTRQPFPPDGAKRHAPATLRNRGPIRDVLREVMPDRGQALEIASGSGEHVVFFAASLPAIIWQPSDADATCLASIAAWTGEADLPNLRPPLLVDARARPWPSVTPSGFEAVICINMIHIAPWEACQGLMAGANRALKAGGILLLYGPFKVDGRHTAPSNAAFEDDLRTMDARFGVRDVADVSAQAASEGLLLERRFQMPANNLSLVFRKPFATR